MCSVGGKKKKIAKILSGGKSVCPSSRKTSIDAVDVTITPVGGLSCLRFSKQSPASGYDFK